MEQIVMREPMVKPASRKWASREISARDYFRKARLDAVKKASDDLQARLSRK